MGVIIEEVPKNDCFPDPKCRCCSCQGIHCFIPHPGHSHTVPVLSPYVMLQSKSLKVY